MGANPILTIAIPTYNRPEQLRRCLEALVPQLNPECWLIIADNHSDVPVASFALEILEQSGWKGFDIHRHPFNKGAHGNLYFCFESATTEWLWILGDDDVPAEDGIDKILSSVKRHPNTLAFAFEVTEFRRNIGGHPPESELHLKRLIEYLASDALYFTSLISSCVLNVPCTREGLIKGYQFASSFFPHLVWIIDSMQKHGGTIIYHPKIIVTCVSDGQRDAPLDPVLPNLRYLTRMLESDHARSSLMDSSYIRHFVGSWWKRLRSPGFFHLMIATAYRSEQPGKNVLRRARRMIGESAEYDQIVAMVPFASIAMQLQLLLAVSLGLVVGPLIRLCYRFKNKNRIYPSLLDTLQQREVP